MAVQVMVNKVRRVESVTVKMDLDTAVVLAYIAGRIGGPPDGPRGLLQRLSEDVRGALGGTCPHRTCLVESGLRFSYGATAEMIRKELGLNHLV